MYNDEARLLWRNLGIFFIKIDIAIRESSGQLFYKV